MKKRSPAFSLYPKDIISDEQCNVMSLEEFGGHVRLLCHAWLEGSIPKDPVKLARLLGISPGKMKKIWSAIEPCWGAAPDRDGRLIQHRLELERERQAARSLHQSLRGSKGGRPKGSTNSKTRGNNPGTIRDKNGKAGESLASPSSSASAVTDLKTPVELEQRPGPAEAGLVAPDGDGRPWFRSEADAARHVFAYWQQRTGHNGAQYTDERKRFILARLREEPGDLAAKAAGLKLAVDGAMVDPLFNGSETGRKYTEFENIFRHKGRDRIEKLQGAAREAALPGHPKISKQTQEAVAAAKRFLENK